MTSNFSFSLSVFKSLVQQTRKNQGLFGKGLRRKRGRLRKRERERGRERQRERERETERKRETESERERVIKRESDREREELSLFVVQREKIF